MQNKRRLLSLVWGDTPLEIIPLIVGSLFAANKLYFVWQLFLVKSLISTHQEATHFGLVKKLVTTKELLSLWDSCPPATQFSIGGAVGYGNTLRLAHPHYQVLKIGPHEEGVLLSECAAGLTSLPHRETQWLHWELCLEDLSMESSGADSMTCL